MRSPGAHMESRDILRNGGIETPSPRPRTEANFHSTVSEQKIRRINKLILVLRFAEFCSSLAAAIFMFSNSRGSSLPNWRELNAFRFVAVANSIVALYSLFEVCASVWEISTGNTLLPEILQVWFDFTHDQAFAYLLISAGSAGTEVARKLREMDTCAGSNEFCIQSTISIALGFAGFFFLVLLSIFSGFRVASFMIKGSRFHL